MRVLELLCLILVLYKSVAIDIDDIALSGCANYTSCEDATNTEIDTPTVSQSGSAATAEASDPETSTGSFTTEYTGDKAGTTAKPAIGATIMNDVKQKKSLTKKNDSYICTCDITISSCDINCCCDTDCNDFQLSVFSHCDDHRPKKYDSRYCYTKNFIQRNNTRFILERLASNLFCIAYDNLPPVYGVSDVPDIKNRKAFENSKLAVDTSKYTWDWHNLVVPLEFNFSSRYRDADVVWKFQANYVNSIELPQSGLTSKCAFGKTVKYLEISKSKCMQTNLSNNNSYLFSEMYENFTVIASPHLFNASYVNAEDHICPDNVCIPVRSLYCGESWSQCDSAKPLGHLCSNGYCRNIVKGVHYTIVHNGTAGIQSIEVRFELTDASQSFYQYFEVTYEWANEDRRHVFSRSVNLGYVVGDPIITGVLFTNITNNVKMEYIKISRSDYYLTVPVSRRNRDCDSRQRYIVGFGEDARLTCNVESKTNNFSSDSCMDLQNKTLKLFLEDTLRNVTDVDKYKTFVSKTGDILTNDTSDWLQILLDRIPPNVVTGQIYNDQIRCSGLVTSLRVEILHTILPKAEDAKSHKIVGVAATFSEPIDISWPKCLETNCTDILRVGIFTYISFTDVSTPSMYYYAGGPNLDISLPYDFFYPFMSSAGDIEASKSPLVVLPIIIVINSISGLFTLL